MNKKNLGLLSLASIAGLASLPSLAFAQSLCPPGVDVTTCNVATVPEPASMLLMGLGLAGAAIARRRGGK